MDGREWRVRLASGSSLVARYGEVVLLAQPEGPAQQEFLDSVLDACRRTATEHPEAPGRRLVRKVAGLVAQADVDDVPDMGVLASLGEDVAVLLVGDVELEIRVEDGQEVISGRDVSTWVDRIVRAPFDALALTGRGAGDIDPRSDLGSGTVTAGGVVLSAGAQLAASAPAAAPAARSAAPATPADSGPGLVPEQPGPTQGAEETSATPVPEADLPATGAPLALLVPEPVTPGGGAPQPVRSTAPFQSFSLAPSQEEPAAPLPVAGVDGDADAHDAEQPDIAGILCSRRHFNDPNASYCAACGISMVHQTHNLVQGKRPPLGVMVFDDGSVIPLNGDYVLGREPGGAPQVLAGSATPLEIDDPELKVSRVHARIALNGWDVRVVDAGSANGTFLLKKGSNDWVRLVPEEPATITPGTRVTMGGRTMEFDSHRKV